MKKVLSTLLAFVMLATTLMAVPFSAQAEDTTSINEVYLTYDTSKIILNTAYREGEVDTLMLDNISSATSGVSVDPGNSGLLYLDGTTINGIGDGSDQITVGRTYLLRYNLKVASGYDWADKLDTTSIKFSLNGTETTPYKIVYNSSWNLYDVYFTLGTPPHTHSYGSEWKSDADNHWHECSLCHDKKDEAAHTSGEWITDTAATATTDGTKHKECTECGYVMETGTIPATGSSSGGGGGGVSTYAITVDSAKHGDVTVSPKNASKGATVTITVEPDKGYTLETLTVTDKNGDEIELTNKGDGKYTFKMPAGKVYVEATFMEDNSMLNFFVDVPADAYYYDAVLWAAKNGITGGVDDTHFAPNATCTRAQVVTFLWRAAGSPAPKNSMMPFTDVPAGSYYEQAVLWAVENGITDGTSATTFSPDAVCSRGQIVTFLWRSQKSPASDSVNPFADVAADAYYNSAVLWAVTNGITDGTSATTFSPAANCTRAQIVTFLWRALTE